MPKERLSHSGVWGVIRDFTKKAQLRKVIQLEDVKTVIDHVAKVECARQRYVLDRLSLQPVSWVSWETGS
jgi:hypothetical protein